MLPGDEDFYGDSKILTRKKRGCENFKRPFLGGGEFCPLMFMISYSRISSALSARYSVDNINL